MKLLFSLFLFPLLILYPSLLLGGYMPENTPPKSLGKNSRVFEDILFEIGTATKAKIVFGSQTVTGNGTSGRIGTSTGLPQIEYDYNGGSPFVNFKDFIGGIKVDGVGIINTTTYLKSWTADNKTGTGTFRLVGGSGINLTATYNGNTGIGTITVIAVGTLSAGGWLDRGTNTASNTGYDVIIDGGQLDLSGSTGVIGLADSDIPNTITLDNITQLTSRSLSDMQGILSLGTQSNKSVVIPDVQIGGLTVGTDTSLLNFANDVFVGSSTGAEQTTISLKDELKGTTSSSAGYLVKLDGSGKLSQNIIPTYPLSHVWFTATNTTFLVPAGITNVYVSLVGGGGGGGGGGGSGSRRGGGGGSSGSGRSLIPLIVTPGQNITVTIGIGGVGGVGSLVASGGNGSAGGNTTFGSIVVAGGYGGVGGNNNDPGDGGAANGYWSELGSAAVNDPDSYGGAGGNSCMGFFHALGTTTTYGYGGGGNGGTYYGGVSDDGMNGVGGCVLILY